MQAIIMAGGKGTRFRKISTTVPKILISIAGKPLIDCLINHLKKNNFDNIIICTGYLGDKVKKYVERKNFGIRIRLSQEDKPLGTAGALHLIKKLLEEELFILYGDVYTTVNLEKMLKFHKLKKSDVTLALHKSDHPQDSTVIKVDKNNKILSFIEKPGNNWKRYGNLTTTPLYIVKKDVIKFIEEDRAIDFAKDVFPKMLKEDKRLFGYTVKEYTKDIGTEDRYKKVQQYLS